MNWSFCLIASDMLGVKERAVIYFFPLEAEIEIITTNDEEYAEILNDYFYYQDRMVEYLKKNGIKSINSSASVIRVQYEGNNNFEYNRKKDISKIGYILIDVRVTILL
jgi:hypothetical protein